MSCVHDGAIGPIGTIGEVLAEMVAERRGQSLQEVGRWLGPFPSGAPAIFIDQVARLGGACAIASAVGDDAFGVMNMERLKSDGVDVRFVRVVPGQATATAFVRYRGDGGRDFVYNVRHSACGRVQLDPTEVTTMRSWGHLHVVGSSLFSPAMVDEVSRAIRAVKVGGGSISFDPNIRKELSSSKELREGLQQVLRDCDIFLPSAAEVCDLTTADNEPAAVREILGLGVSAVVIKRGASGATYVDDSQIVHSPPYLVNEVDPTGAGDCFAAGFVVSWLRGAGVHMSLRMANACGARACTVVGPMEGASRWSALEQWMRTARQQATF